MLTPAKTDPNRKQELKRKEKDPKAFGAPLPVKVKGVSVPEGKPADWTPSTGLRAPVIKESITVQEQKPEPKAQETDNGPENDQSSGIPDAPKTEKSAPKKGK